MAGKTSIGGAGWALVCGLALGVGLPSTGDAQPVPAATPPPPDTVTLSIVGTTDLHGRVFATNGRGGLALLGGYLRNLRAVRVEDGGAVLLLDAGDTFQGGIESNISEGALVVDAYNAMGYDALAVGNHDFEYGAHDSATGADAEDMRGALKAAAARARFPFLAANVIDDATGEPVSWTNVRPSTMVETGGIQVGIVGGMTHGGLRQTIRAHVQGLSTIPLLPAVESEARRLRTAGADVVLVLSHEGGWCERFDDPLDLSSCGHDSKIFRLARELPPGLVDGIVAGHTHAGVAHEVAGIPVVQAFQRGAAFARLDLYARPGVGVIGHRIFAPQGVCTVVDAQGACTTVGDTPSTYEGVPVGPDPDVVAAMQPQLDWVEAWRAEPLGVLLETPLDRRSDGLESPLGNLFAEALLAAVPDADVAIGLGVRRGGLRTGLPAGPLTRGPLYDAFAFDNRVVTLSLTAGELAALLARSAARSWSGIPSVAGMVVRVTCGPEGADIDLARVSGERIEPDERLTVAATDFFGRRVGVGTLSGPAESLPSAALVRDAAASWLRARNAPLHVDEFSAPRWQPTGDGACLAAS